MSIAGNPVGPGGHALLPTVDGFGSVKRASMGVPAGGMPVVLLTGGSGHSVLTGGSGSLIVELVVHDEEDGISRPSPWSISKGLAVTRPKRAMEASIAVRERTIAKLYKKRY